MSEANVMERLRAETVDLHAGAEGKDFQRRMVKGEITLEDYRRWLAQMLHVHRALEAPLHRLMGEHPAFAAVREGQMQEPHLREDLAALGADPEAFPPLPPTAALVSEIARCAAESPLSLLGFLYVLEGSNNGNRFIARRLVLTLGLGDAGHRYLDPYGESQTAKWAEFKREMNHVKFSGEDADILVAAARRMFQAIGEISEALSAAPAGD